MKVLTRTILALTVAALLLVGGAAAVFAAGPSSLEAQGTILSVDTGAKEVVIKTADGDVTLMATDSTIITKGGMGKITIEELVAGDRAVAVYQTVDEVNNAIRIMAKAPLAKHHAYVGILINWSEGGFTVTPKKGDAVDIVVNDQTKYKVPGVKDATINNFKDDDKVAVLAVESDEVITALHVVLIPGKPVFVQRVGTIKDYVEDEYITLDGKKGESTFTVTADTKFISKNGALVPPEDIVGQRAVVIAQRVPSEDTFTARTILVFPAKEK
jgi:hypothetical protein